MTQQGGLAEQGRFKPGDSPIVRGSLSFSAEELAELRGLVDEESIQGTLQAGHDGIALENIRRSHVRWLNREEHGWVFDRCLELILLANKKYLFDITTILEKIQLSIYDESEQGFYRWHCDLEYFDMRRKLSLTVPLNSPYEYEGGQLEFNTNGNPFSVDQEMGRPVVFPSFVLHRVTPVTKGSRYSLVAWAGGAPLC